MHDDSQEGKIGQEPFGERTAKQKKIKNNARRFETCLPSAYPVPEITFSFALSFFISFVLSHFLFLPRFIFSLLHLPHLSQLPHLRLHHLGSCILATSTSSLALQLHIQPTTHTITPYPLAEQHHIDAIATLSTDNPTLF